MEFSDFKVGDIIVHKKHPEYIAKVISIKPREPNSHGSIGLEWVIGNSSGLRFNSYLVFVRGAYKLANDTMQVLYAD